ncbi:nucleotidyltransferase domain-containing protein [Marinicrinis lubricantis]|uniref:Nucleotidyltransferase domain-containing protein n=1 Tax=Marinicrinis lubricantis TaxID=2086470 RepID=A0ABW1IQQ9_9BACL
MQTNEPMTAAKACVEERFPDAKLAVLGGSTASGLWNVKSDLDIVIIDDTEPYPFRQSFMYGSWPVEVFLMTSRTYMHFFEESVEKANPTLLRLVAQGKVLVDHGIGEPLIRKAAKLLQDGPGEAGFGELDELRYWVTEQLEDFAEASDPGEALFSLHKLTDQLQRLILRSKGCWTGDGKWIARCLKEADEPLYLRLISALEAYHRDGRKEPILALAEDVLEPLGGRFFEGYMAITYK